MRTDSSLTKILHQAENPNPKRERGAHRFLAYASGCDLFLDEPQPLDTIGKEKVAAASGWDWCIETRNCPSGAALRCLTQKSLTLRRKMPES